MSLPQREYSTPNVPFTSAKRPRISAANYVSEDTPAGTKFFGFRGRVHDAIEWIQAVCVRFEPPTWSAVEVL